MTDALTQLRPPASPPIAHPSSPLRRAAADFWLNTLFWQSRRAPWLGRMLKPLAMHLACRHSHVIRTATCANARRIFGPDVSQRQIDTYAAGMLSSFFDFVCDVGRCVDLSDQQLRAQIESIEGDDAYRSARAAKKGAIIVTAHMGSFEAAAAALIEREKRIHVVFKRDAMNRFEQVRSALRRRLGVIEAPIDDGWSVWLGLRDALARDEVVMLQADRVMPGQKGCIVPFLHGRLELPIGPIKLALASGAPIVPVFAIRTSDSRVRIHIEPPIWVEPSDHWPHPALLKIASILEKYVRSYPQQWLLVHRAFCDDTSSPKSQEDAA